MIENCKRCQSCELFIIHVGLWCPCCGQRLRTKPRNNEYREKLRLAKESANLALSRVRINGVISPV